ncbi:MAG: phosphate/phosphite/phosphonate ABC transporter substrate-binding protein, partial [Gammaproteobacteria bacterium]|nr:phosphate/phosphite/phosphonate ABC transporter substrate-binding protein [Gammaproteobacteria bacterium]
KHGYISLVRNNRKGLEGILLVRADSEVRNISQLNDKVIAFPSPNAFAASLYLRAYLVEVEGINFEPFYVGTHDNVYRQISSGQVIAGGGIVRTLNFQPDDLRQRLKIIYRTELLASHPLSTSPLVSERQREAILSAIFQLSRTDEGKALLKTIKLSNPIRANHDLDYAPLGKMNISKYASIGKD